MTSETFVMLSGALSFGLPLALAMLDVATIRPSGGGGDDEPPPPVAPLPLKPLPECLLPRPVVAGVRRPVRVLEDA